MKNLFFLVIILLFSFSWNQTHAQLNSQNGAVGNITNGSTNNVGVGTATPQQKLHVNGNFRVERTGSPANQQNYVEGVISSYGLTSQGGPILKPGAFVMRLKSVSSPASFGGMVFSASGQADLEIDREGRVGMDDMRIFFKSRLGNNNFNGLSVLNDQGLFWSDKQGTGNLQNANGGFVIGPWAGGDKGLRIDNNGNVSIGTSDSKGYTLAVNGNMVAEEVVVKLSQNWPDYVFAADYDMDSLGDVEKAIDKDGHLPGMPSADEVEAQGINMGPMVTIQQEKIEELFLHLIEMEKEMKTLKEKVELLENQNKNEK